jgi:predicted transcriptional regulator of viral defense system
MQLFCIKLSSYNDKCMHFYTATMNAHQAEQKTIELFKEYGGTLRTSEALRLGIYPRTLYTLRDAGILEKLSRGLYRLAELPALPAPDLAIVVLKIPQAVICLVSALAFHELTTQVPHAVNIALPRGARSPRLDYPPLRIFRFSGPAWSEGVETYQIGQTSVRIYCPEKSVADSFKYRRKLGLDVAIEALKLHRQSPRFEVSKLLHYARICRVESIMKPYLEALL